MITKDNKTQAIAKTQIHKTDVGSAQAQSAILTARIHEITEHMKANKHDFAARRGLLRLVGQRKKMLRYLERNDFDAYKNIVSTLGLRK